jgi:Heterokaryon incompatibility protein (HET)
MSADEKARRTLPSLSTLSNKNTELVLKWISECKSRHHKCYLGGATWVPTRLLDVGPEDGSKVPRLVETARENIQAPYAALSHMWGDSSHIPPLRTLTSRYEAMKSGIQMWELSTNFADAVVVARKLGLRYIWIDSLCIIQDSLSDWNREAATMHEVYKYAEVTIAA